MALGKIFREQEREHDRDVAAFTAELDEIVARAQAATLGELREALKVEGGLVERTRSNRRTLANVAAAFRRNMIRFGYFELVGEFAALLDDQFGSFEAVLDELAKGTQLAKPVFSGKDLALIEVTRDVIVGQFEDVLTRIGLQARTAALLGMRSLPLRQLTDVLAQRFSKTPGQARVIAGTGISTFHRAIALRSFEKIEQETGEKLRFTYGGPRDILNRPWCVKMLGLAGSGKTWTMAEIRALVADPLRGTNQPSDVWLTAGGWECRHRWLLSLED